MKPNQPIVSLKFNLQDMWDPLVILILATSVDCAGE